MKYDILERDMDVQFCGGLVKVFFVVKKCLISKKDKNVRHGREKRTFMKNQKRFAQTVMFGLVLLWGLDYIAAKFALEALDTMTILMFKYGLALIITAVRKIVIKKEKGFIKKRDILTFIACSILGEILYFACEYEALDHMPVAMVTVMLTLVPIFSILLERILYKKKASGKMIIGIIGSIAGVIIIIGIDLDTVLQGQFIGYILCLGAVLSWNAYNFVTDHLGERYEPLTLTFNQMFCTVLLSAPLGLARFPGVEVFDDIRVLGGILYLGTISAGIGFSIYVYSTTVLGPTPMAIYSNFLPVSAALFGWIILGESLTAVQILGGILVILSGLAVIIEKGKMEDESGEKELKPHHGH